MSRPRATDPCPGQAAVGKRRAAPTPTPLNGGRRNAAWRTVMVGIDRPDACRPGVAAMRLRRNGIPIDIPDGIIGRHRFPGPGLAIRILPATARERVIHGLPRKRREIADRGQRRAGSASPSGTRRRRGCVWRRRHGGQGRRRMPSDTNGRGSGRDGGSAATGDRRSRVSARCRCPRNPAPAREVSRAVRTREAPSM